MQFATAALPASQCAELQQHMASIVTETSEAFAKLCRHEIVEYRVHGRIKVEHDAAEVEQTVVTRQSDVVQRLLRAQDDPQGEHSEWEQADEKREHNGAQHEDHLLAGLQTELRLGGAGTQHGALVGDEVARNDPIQHDEYEKRQHEEHGDGHQKETDCGKANRLGQADGHR